MTQATLTWTATDPAERMAAGLADVFGAISPDQVEFIQGQAVRISIEAEAMMPREIPGFLAGRPAPRTHSSLSLDPQVLAGAQVIARELHATTDDQLAWVGRAAEGLWSEIMCEMPSAFED